MIKKHLDVIENEISRLTNHADWFEYKIYIQAEKCKIDYFLKCYNENNDLWALYELVVIDLKSEYHTIWDKSDWPLILQKIMKETDDEILFERAFGTWTTRFC